MKKIPRGKQTLLFFMTCLILIILGGLYLFVWHRFYLYDMEAPFYRRGNWLLCAIYIAILYIFNRIYGGYRIGFYRVTEIIYSQLLSLGFVNAVTYFQISLIARRMVNAIPIIFLLIVQALLATVWALATNKLYFWLYPPRRMILIHTGSYSESIFWKMNTRKEKFNITHRLRFEGEVESILPLLSDYEAVVFSGIPSHARNKLVRFCYENYIRVYIVPTVIDIISGSSEYLTLFDTPLLLLRNRGLSLEDCGIKRTLDLLISSIGLLLASPVMLIVSICIKIYDGGPVLYKQTRLTINGKEFQIYKFRSMIVDAEKDGVARLASRKDDRITPIGHVIRKLRLDELPQLINVWKGDMSIVGPRPERPEIEQEYEKILPEFRYRLRVKAGLTGYAQILGKYNTTPQDKLLLDLMYIENWTILLDLKLIFMTLKVLFMPESTEGVHPGSILPIEVCVPMKEKEKKNQDFESNNNQ
ncbi:exopolysaccharide biosynthesis polyprenyl glycosylphosphotransferase [Anaerotruncus colihominis]|uniref:exopolysaccharide biosynthesis polyprenyl glycosylphosphotransferase n=1 Tax=Anaerotruncus colihominis TaxID=169435 RepID=UPI00242A3F01|nr:exopolysaccharide biosynthesis polyprenyl glycosylphosphotransferase [Anaerotruncus colihominis]